MGTPEYNAAYRADPARRETARARAQRWREDNPDRAAALDRERRARRAQWNAEHPEQAAAVLRKQRYGIAPDEYVDMVVAQDGKCAICEREKPLVVDHDHVTGKVRGLLCKGCNVAIARFGDSAEGVLRAVAYLLRDE